ncbi:MAG: hydrogenase maturation protease [Syntrophomonadaceae bacterium]
MRLVVVGIGNIFMQDDGLGVYVIQKLSERSWPEEVELVDAGIASFEILDVFCRADVIIVVDSMSVGGDPGTIYRAPLERLGLRSNGNITSMHELHFTEAIKVVNLMGYHPRVIVFGVEPYIVDVGLELTPLIADKMPRLLELVEAEIKTILSTAAL